MIFKVGPPKVRKKERKEKVKNDLRGMLDIYVNRLKLRRHFF
jgi:hypothetical protein